ncbi:unnamed protein product, partial [Polarella glacialis]
MSFGSSETCRSSRKGSVSESCSSKDSVSTAATLSCRPSSTSRSSTTWGELLDLDEHDVFPDGTPKSSHIQELPHPRVAPKWADLAPDGADAEESPPEVCSACQWFLPDLEGSGRFCHRLDHLCSMNRRMAKELQSSHDGTREAALSSSTYKGGRWGQPKVRRDLSPSLSSPKPRLTAASTRPAASSPPCHLCDMKSRMAGLLAPPPQAGHQRSLAAATRGLPPPPPHRAPMEPCSHRRTSRKQTSPPGGQQAA